MVSLRDGFDVGGSSIGGGGGGGSEKDNVGEFSSFASRLSNRFLAWVSFADVCMYVTRFL